MITVSFWVHGCDKHNDGYQANVYIVGVEWRIWKMEYIGQLQSELSTLIALLHTIRLMKVLFYPTAIFRNGDLGTEKGDHMVGLWKFRRRIGLPNVKELVYLITDGHQYLENGNMYDLTWYIDDL